MKKYSLILLLILSSCGSPQQEKNSTDDFLVDLVKSTQIIRTLLCQNKLGDLLEDHDPEQLTVLIDNVSPAKMAFESEVLSATAPLVLVYYFKDSPEAQEFIVSFKALAAEYDNRVKCVIVDSDKLFSLAQDANIELFPTTLFIKNRDIIECIDHAITIDGLKEVVKRMQE